MSGWSQEDRGDEAPCVYLHTWLNDIVSLSDSDKPRVVKTSCQLDTVLLSHSVLFVCVNDHGLRDLHAF